jgi:transcriptional regulator with XRE-family HTH domain
MKKREIKIEKRICSEDLEGTLARRVLQLREMRNLTLLDLSERSHFTVKRLEDIEAGLETWLSASDRQRLARALVVDAITLQEVEVRRALDKEDTVQYAAILREIADSVLTGARELTCPQCGNTLRCRVQEGLDIDGQPIYFAKAYCLKCPFTLK